MENCCRFNREGEMHTRGLVDELEFRSKCSETFDEGGRCVQSDVPHRSPVIVRQPNAAFTAGRFFNLSSHGVEVVGGGDHGKQDHQHTGQSQQSLQRSKLVTRIRGS